MCGALFQFVPVLVARPLYSQRLPLPAMVLLMVGLASLLLGFMQVDGAIRTGLPLLPIATVPLGAGFGLVVWNLGHTLWKARPLPLSARFVGAGLASLAAGGGLGIVFALVLGSSTTSPLLIALAKAGLPIHIVAGLAGWLTFTAMGVTYRLLSMFMLSPEPDGGSGGTFWLGSLALIATIVGGIAAILLEGPLDAVLSCAAAFATLALGLYGREVFGLFWARKRRILELNSLMAGYAFASLLAAVLLASALLGLGKLADRAGAVIFLVAFGFLSGLVLAKLYKIVAFLTWLECYGPALGKTPTPRVQDLVVETRARKWFVLFFASVWCATAALLVDAAVAFRIAAFLMLVATSGIALHLTLARRLSAVRAGVSAGATAVSVFVIPFVLKGAKDGNHVCRCRCPADPASRRRTLRRDHAGIGRAQAASGSSAVRAVQADAAVRRDGIQGVHLRSEGARWG
jgi:hypothetical protein